MKEQKSIRTKSIRFRKRMTRVYGRSMIPWATTHLFVIAHDLCNTVNPPPTTNKRDNQISDKRQPREIQETTKK